MNRLTLALRTVWHNTQTWLKFLKWSSLKMASRFSTSTQPVALRSIKSWSRSAGESQWESDDCRHYRANHHLVFAFKYHLNGIYHRHVFNFSTFKCGTSRQMCYLIWPPGGSKTQVMTTVISKSICLITRPAISATHFNTNPHHVRQWQKIQIIYIFFFYCWQLTSWTLRYPQLDRKHGVKLR